MSSLSMPYPKPYVSDLQIERALTDPDYGERAAAIARFPARLALDQIERAFKDPHARVRYMAIECLAYRITRPIIAIEAALRDTDADVRCSAVHRFARFMTPAQIERALTDPHDSNVRRTALVAFAKQMNQDQIERALNDPDAIVKKQAILNWHTLLSPEHIDGAFNDSGTRALAVRRLSERMTDATVACALQDADAYIRVNAIRAFSHRMTPAQIDAALADTTADVRCAAIRCLVDQITTEQIDHVLEDEDPAVVEVLVEQDIPLTREQVERTIERTSQPGVRYTRLQTLLGQRLDTLDLYELNAFSTTAKPSARDAAPSP